VALLTIMMGLPSCSAPCNVAIGSCHRILSHNCWSQVVGGAIICCCSVHACCGAARSGTWIWVIGSVIVMDLLLSVGVTGCVLVGMLARGV